ncbi:MAG: hypothetical protein LJE83_11415, partial [Gammaproteobacteria bacterium]|nr:hypothetical protein [Gammaproteobacteria bacterium]
FYLCVFTTLLLRYVLRTVLAYVQNAPGILVRSFAEKIVFPGRLHMAGYALKAQPNEGLLTGFRFAFSFDLKSAFVKPTKPPRYHAVKKLVKSSDSFHRKHMITGRLRWESL